MTDQFQLASAADPFIATFKHASNSTFHVTLAGPALAASADVYHIGGDGLHEFFADLARHWRGWEGEKSWHSLEATLRISASSDRAGHITLGVQLDNGTPADFRVNLILCSRRVPWIPLLRKLRGLLNPFARPRR